MDLWTEAAPCLKDMLFLPGCTRDEDDLQRESGRGTPPRIAALEFVRVFLKYGIEVFNFGLQGRSWKPKEHDTGMGKCLVKDQLAEIPVSDDQNTFLFPCDCQDILIRQTRRIITRNSSNVMAKLTKVRHQSKVSALIEEEFHRAASERTPLGGFGETSLPVTIACA